MREVDQASVGRRRRTEAAAANGRNGWKADIQHSDEVRPAFRASVSKRQVHAARFLAPEAGPEPLISRKPFLRFEVGEGRITALVAWCSEQPDTWDEANKSNKRGPPIAERPSDKAGQQKCGACDCCEPLPTPRDMEPCGNPIDFIAHQAGGCPSRPYVRNGSNSDIGPGCPQWRDRRRLL